MGSHVQFATETIPISDITTDHGWIPITGIPSHQRRQVQRKHTGEACSLGLDEIFDWSFREAEGKMGNIDIWFINGLYGLYMVYKWLCMINEFLAYLVAAVSIRVVSDILK